MNKDVVVVYEDDSGYGLGFDLQPCQFIMPDGEEWLTARASVPIGPKGTRLRRLYFGPFWAGSRRETYYTVLGPSIPGNAYSPDTQYVSDEFVAMGNECTNVEFRVKRSYFFGSTKLDWEQLFADLEHGSGWMKREHSTT